MARISNRIEHSSYKWDDFSGQAGGHGKLTVTAHSGYEFNPDYEYNVKYYSYSGSGPFNDNLTVSSDKKKAVWLPSIDISESKATTVTGYLDETTPPGPTVTNNVSGATETHTYENGVLNITIKANTNGYILKDIVATVGATNTPFVLDDTETTGTLHINVSATDTVVISGSTVKTLPVVQKLANCTSNNKPYYPVGEHVYFTVTADNGKVFNEIPTVEYLTIGQTEKVYLTVSENKKTAIADFVLDVSAQVQIILTANAVQETPIAKKYGSINIYLTNEKELAQFANLRFKQITSEYYITKDYGQFVNRIKRIFARIPNGDTDVMFFGNYNSQIATHVPEKLRITLDFGTVTISDHNKDNTDYESNIQLFVPFKGLVSISNEYVGKDIHLYVDINVITGGGLYRLVCDDIQFQTGECTPSIDVLYETVDMKKLVGGDTWNENLYMGLEPYVILKWYESASNGLNNDRKTGVLGDFRGFNIFDDITPIHTAEMLTDEQEMIYNALQTGVYIE